MKIKLTLLPTVALLLAFGLGLAGCMTGGSHEKMMEDSSPAAMQTMEKDTMGETMPGAMDTMEKNTMEETMPAQMGSMEKGGMQSDMSGAMK